MKQRVTQRLFWKKWPYKVIVDLTVPERPATVHTSRWTKAYTRQRELHPEWANFRRWQKKNLPTVGVRGEGGCISLFLENQEQVDQVADAWSKYIKEIWSPQNEQALDLMQSHVYDVIRTNPWYKRFPIRARILYTPEFRHNGGLDLLQQALTGIDQGDWHAAGALAMLLTKPDSKMLLWAYGQPYYLYLADNDDAVMLKLQVGDWIDRFERQRKP